MDNNLPIEKATTQAYVPHVTQVYNVCAENMICTSQNEKVGETDGEW